MNNKKTDNNLSDSACIIIRSAGERTEFLCKELVLAQGFPEENITVIKEVPFSRSLYASYEAGIAFDRAWTLCLDADVLLLPDSIREMILLAEKQDPSIFEIRGLILDKFFGGPRQGGIHLYRTSLLSQALNFIPQEQEQIRPEQHTLNAMKSLGFSWKRVDYLIGIHDFEQYYADIFRKCFAQTHKHQEYAEIFLSYWPQQGINDFDYKVAMKGLVAGLEYEGDVRIDAQQEIYRECFEKLRIVEKADLPRGYFSLSDINLLVRNWVEPPVYQKYFQFEMISHANEKAEHSIRKKNLAEKRRALGPLKFLVYLLGWGGEQAGERLKKLVDKQEDN
jgi:hypothetical protein